MKRFALFLGTFFLASLAAAAVITANWTIATTNTDGTPILATGPTSLTGTTVQWGPCNAARDALASVSGSTTTSPSASSFSTPNLAAGWWCGQARHINMAGEMSAWSNVGSKFIEPPPSIPNAPANFSFGS